MIIRDLSTASAEDLEVSTLIQTLHDAGKRLEELTEGEVDAVADAGGRTFLLRSAQDQLRIFEASKQAAVLNALPANIALVDALGVIVSVNDAWRSFVDTRVRHAPGHAIGINYLAICDSAIGDGSTESHAAAAALRAVLCGGSESVLVEYRCDSQAQERWFRMYVSPLAQDRASGAVVMHLDVTARVLVAAALDRQRAELRVLVDLMPAMIWFKDIHNRILRVNQRVADAAGKSLAEIEGKPSAEIYPEDAARNYSDDLDVIRSGESKLEIVEPRQFPDGSMHWVQTDKVPFFGPQGDVAGIVVMERDVTAQREADTDRHREGVRLPNLGRRPRPEAPGSR